MPPSNPPPSPQNQRQQRSISDVAAQLGAVFFALNQGLSALQSGVSGFVALANPAAVVRFNRAVADTNAVLGQILTPTLETITKLFRQIGDVMDGLSPTTKKMIGILAQVVVGMGATAVVLGALYAAFSVVTGGILPFITALASATLGFAMFGGGAEKLKPLMESIGGAFDALMKGLYQAFLDLEPILTTITNYIAGFAKALQDFMGGGDFKAGNSVGKAVRQASIGSVGDLATSQYQMAFQGAGSSPESQTAKNTEKIERNTARIAEIAASIVRFLEMLGFEKGDKVATPEDIQKSYGTPGMIRGNIRKTTN